MRFKTWLKQFLDEDTQFGDLANDVVRDENFPTKNEYNAIYTYLQTNSACNDAIETFVDAWDEYKNGRKTK